MVHWYNRGFPTASETIVPVFSQTAVVVSTPRRGYPSTMKHSALLAILALKPDPNEESLQNTFRSFLSAQLDGNQGEV